MILSHARAPFTRSGLWTLLAATALLPVANGRWSIALAAWLAPAILVRYLRTQPLARALAGGMLAMSVAEYFWWKGIFPLSGATYVIASVVFAAVNLVPYLLDRALATRAGGFAGTLLLPSAMVLHETLTELVSPFGSWGSFAYTQSSNLPLLQLLSITGIAGVTFLVLWFASIVNWLAESPRERRRRAAAGAFVVLVAAVHVFGAVRLLRKPGGAAIRVAAITPPIPTYTVRGDDANSAVHDALASVRRGRGLEPAAADAFRRRAAAINRELLDRTEREAKRGAMIVLWSEGAGVIDAKDEAVLVAEGAEVARRSRSFVALSFLTLDVRAGKRFANRSVLLDDTGRTVWTYDKARPVPGMEDNLRPGDGRVPLATTPFARIAGVICYDLDFPGLMRQAGRNRADVVLVAADDWAEIAATHARMAKFRAIELGVTLVRSASNGTSAFHDRYGRTLATADYVAREFTLAGAVPARSAPTLYMKAPMLVTAFAAIAFVFVLLRALTRRLRTPVPAPLEDLA